MSEALVKFWDDDAPAEIVDEQCEKLQIATFSAMDEATEAQAKRMHREVLSRIGDVFATLRRIHETKAYNKLGFADFKDYLASLRKQSEAFSIDPSKFYRLMRWDEVRDRLIADGYDKGAVNNLRESHTELFHQKLPPGLWGQAFEKLLQEKRSTKLYGKAAEFDHPYNYTAEMVKCAIDRQLHAASQSLPEDPYADEDDAQGNVAPLEPIFDATGDGRFVPDPGDFADRPDFFDNRTPAAPPLRRSTMPTAKPPAPVMPDSDKSQFQASEEICLAFVGIEPHQMDDDVVWIQGTDGPSVYAIPVRREQLREVLA